MSSGEGLVGRQAELGLAAAAIRQLREGRASALAIEGEAGIGKTRLVQSIIDDACPRDAPSIPALCPGANGHAGAAGYTAGWPRGPAPCSPNHGANVA